VDLKFSSGINAAKLFKRICRIAACMPAGIISTKNQLICQRSIQRFPPTIHIIPQSPREASITMSDPPAAKRKPSASPQTSSGQSSKAVETSDGFTKVETKEERRKKKKIEKRRPQFQFDMSAFRSGKKVGMAVRLHLQKEVNMR